jgi:hypothetical protein
MESMRLLGSIAIAGLVASVLAGCEHHALGRRYPYQTGSGTPGVYDAGDSACAATCKTPLGTFLDQPADADLWAGIVGVWRICSGNPAIFVEAPGDAIGVEFAPPLTDGASPLEGNLFFLTSGPSGPVRGAGFEYQQIYQISDGVLYCHASFNSGYDFQIHYSPCPRQWQIATWGNPGSASVLAGF